MKLFPNLLSVLFVCIHSCYATAEKIEAVSINSKLGQGFGKTLVLEGIPDRSEPHKKGYAFNRFCVLKINGKPTNKPINIKLIMLNSASEYEFNIYSKTNLPTPLILLGYESLSATGIPEGINQTLETMEQTSKWNIETYFILVRTSCNSDGWPEKRNGILMNQVRHITCD